MTEPTPTVTIPRPVLPAYRLDYEAGTFANSLTGAISDELTGVVLAYRAGRTLWPAQPSPDPRPECVDGSKYGPCAECRFAEWGPQGEPPICDEELTLLVWERSEFQVVELTARRSQVRTVEQWLGMKSLTTGVLYDQEVTITMKEGDGLHRLVLLPGVMLLTDALERMRQVAERAERWGFGGL